jgi:hypothetical protein
LYLIQIQRAARATLSALPVESECAKCCALFGIVPLILQSSDQEIQRAVELIAIGEGRKLQAAADAPNRCADRVIRPVHFSPKNGNYLLLII